MNIKKRLFISNLLMIVIPVVISLFAGISVVVVLWYSLANGIGFGTDDARDFYKTCDLIAEVSTPLIKNETIDNLDDTLALEQLLDSSNISMLVCDAQGTVYSHGNLSAEDQQLLLAAQSFGEIGQITANDRCLDVRNISTDTTTYFLYLFGDSASGSERATNAAIALALAAIIVLVGLAIFFTNRFLTNFVLRHITSPLELLTEGVEQVKQGNLSHRIAYPYHDEFTPAFAAFNTMAIHMEDSLRRERRSQEKRRELIVGLSHDLRSPLTSIKGYTEGLLDGIAKTPEKQISYLQTIEKKTIEIEKLANQLSLLARTDSNDQETELFSLSLDGVIEDWINENKDTYRLQGIEITSHLEPALIKANPEMLSRILSNIVDNSAKYAQTSSDLILITIDLCVRTCTATLTISDNGPGVDDDALPKLFDLFYREDPARKSPHEGNGIGLAVVSQLVTQMDATVHAYNVSPHGLAIFIEFPLINKDESFEA